MNVGMFHYGSNSFIIGEVAHAIVNFIQACKNLTYQQDDIVEKMFEFAFNEKDYVHKHDYITDMLVNFPHWVDCKYHLKPDFQGYFFNRDYVSMGYKTKSLNLASCDNSVLLPIKGKIQLAEAS